MLLFPFRQIGFLSTNPSPMSHNFRKISNYGLMDIIGAMHYIKENIIAFGGNPENITLLGD
jgi:para-nitrobenzyl esterase